MSTTLLTLIIDPSNKSICGVIVKKYDLGIDKTISYVSRKLSWEESNYLTTDKKAFAIILGVRKFIQYLCIRTFYLQKDHIPREKIFGENNSVSKNISSRLVRWGFILNV